MKAKLFYILFLLLSFQHLYAIPKVTLETSCQESTFSLEGIEKRIFDAFVESTMKSDFTSMQQLETGLKSIQQKNQQNLIWYWRSYLNYYKAIYFIKQGDKTASEKACDEAVDWLEKLKKKTSEDYAMLAMIQSFSIQFKGQKAMFLSSKIKKNAKKAIALNPKNLRAHYVFASNDFYTPAQYGGGKQAEKFLLKAIDLPSQKVKNPYLPSWGKEEAYSLLIKHYIKAKELNNARKYFKQGLQLYPNSYGLKELATQLIE